MSYFFYMTSRFAFIVGLTWGVGALLHAMANPLLLVWVLVGVPVSVQVLFIIEERFSL